MPDLIAASYLRIASAGRDPFLQKQIREDFPGTTLWQRYAHDEYAQLAYEEELRDQQGGDFEDDFSTGSGGGMDDGDREVYDEMGRPEDDDDDDGKFLFDADIRDGHGQQDDIDEWLQ